MSAAFPSDTAASSLTTVVSWLYEAFFDRIPEIQGEQYWTRRLNEGMTVQSMADAFMASPEFQARYGTAVSDGAFVRLLYNNLLEREPDTAGWGYWTGHLASGMTRAQVVEGFFTSPEYLPNPVIAATGL